jgi:hypothetical protein
MLIYEFRLKWDIKEDYGMRMSTQKNVVKYMYSNEEIKAEEMSNLVNKIMEETEAINPEIDITINNLVVNDNRNFTAITTINDGTMYPENMCGDNISYTSK